jgi:hypothetical protein
MLSHCPEISSKFVRLWATLDNNCNYSLSAKAETGPKGPAFFLAYPVAESLQTHVHARG